jgi:cellulose synthase (UDP-forming)
MAAKDKFFGCLGVFLGLAYLVWLALNVHEPLGVALLLADAGFVSLAALYLFNHWTQAHLFESDAPPAGSLDVFLPVVSEPLELFEQTLRAAVAIDYSPKTVYVLDDGGRPDIQLLARRYGAAYLARETNADYKAGNLNYGLQHSGGEFILVLDADQVTRPEIARELLGHFAAGPKVAIVAARQAFDVPEGDFNHDYLFYGQSLPGKNADNAAISCGSGVFYRRSALDQIGGFQTWNLVEDLYTSYVLHARGFTSLYINKSYTVGLAPLDLPTIYKQRGVWAVDTLRIFFKHNPLLQKGLTVRQKWHYFEMGWTYLVSALALPAIFVLIPLSLLTNTAIVPAFDTYLLLRFPALYFTVLFFYLQSGHSLSVHQFWISLFPVYLRAIPLALLPNRPVYRVTSKTGSSRARYLSFVLPHLGLIGLNAGALLWNAAQHGFGELPAAGAIWLIFIVNWFWPILGKGLGLEPPAGESRREVIVRNYSGGA